MRWRVDCRANAQILLKAATSTLWTCTQNGNTQKWIVGWTKWFPSVICAMWWVTLMFWDKLSTDVVFEFGDFLLEYVDSDFVVLDHAVDLQLLDAITNWHQFGGTPEQTVHLHWTHTLLQLGHVRLVIPLREREREK